MPPASSKARQAASPISVATCGKDCTDAEALEISLTENLAREDADELTYYEAFLSSTLKGRSVGEIARTYGKNEREVEQYLALANLLPRIRELYRDEELDGATCAFSLWRPRRSSATG